MFLTRWMQVACCLLTGICFLFPFPVYARPAQLTQHPPSTYLVTDTDLPIRTLVVFISASTNACADTIVLRSTGEATILKCGTVLLSVIPQALATKVFQDMIASEPLTHFPLLAPCLKSLSFGTTTIIAFAAQKTPDLSCLQNANEKFLYHDVELLSTALLTALPLPQ